MGLADQLLKELQDMPVQQQQEVLDFVGFLKTRKRCGVLYDPFGLLRGLSPDLTCEDIDRVRKEIWAGFPREDV